MSQKFLKNNDRKENNKILYSRVFINENFKNKKDFLGILYFIK